MPGVEVAKNKEELIKKSDIISLHIPGGNATKGLVNKDFLKAMKVKFFIFKLFSAKRNVIKHCKSHCG